MLFNLFFPFFVVGCVDYLFSKKIDPEDTAIATDNQIPNLFVESMDLGIVCQLEAQNLLLQNRGDGELLITGLSIEGDGWTLEEQALPFSLAAHAERKLSITPAYQSAALIVESDDPDEPRMEILLSTVENQPPTIELNSPQAGDLIGLFPTDMSAMVLDDVDSPEYLVLQWRSSVDGVFGIESPDPTGLAQVVWNPYHTPGSHTIQLMVTDSCGATTSQEAWICQQDGYLSEKMADEDWRLEGSAHWDNEQLFLQSTESTATGSAFFWPRELRAGALSIQFRFRIDDLAGFAGFAVLGMDALNAAGFVGGDGDCLGYATGEDCSPVANALPGWAIEIDTRHDSTYDLSESDHMTMVFDGQRDNLQAWTELPELEEGSWYELSMTIQEQQLMIRIDGHLYIDQMIEGDLDFSAYIGFSAAGGAMTLDSLVVTELDCGG